MTDSFRLSEDVENKRCEVLAKHVFLFNKLSKNAFGKGVTPFDELHKSSVHALDFLEVLIAESSGARLRTLEEAYVCILNGIEKATDNAILMCQKASLIHWEAEGRA